MKSFSLHIKILLFILFLSSITLAQLKIGLGSYIGGGTIKGESPSITAFTSSVYIETNMDIFLEVTPRLGFIYAKDLDAVLPNVQKPYFPFVQGFYFKGIVTQYLEGGIFVEEGIGLLALNDRTFRNTDVWGYGVVLSFAAGWDLRGFNLNGFKLGAGIEYGITFNNTLVQYSSLNLYINYTL